MSVLFLAFAILLTLLLITGWVLLLAVPLVAMSATTAGGLVVGMTHVKRSLPALSAGTVRGILGIHGLASEPELALRLRSEIARVLTLAMPATQPLACACIKESEGAFTGVLRIFNTQGHYLQLATGDGAAAVVAPFLAALGESGNTFPAKVGARRAQCPECDPATCPLRGRKRKLALAAA